MFTGVCLQAQRAEGEKAVQGRMHGLLESSKLAKKTLVLNEDWHLMALSPTIFAAEALLPVRGINGTATLAQLQCSTAKAEQRSPHSISAIAAQLQLSKDACQQC